MATKASYPFRVIEKLFKKADEEGTHFWREGENDDANVPERAKRFAMIWHDLKNFREQREHGDLTRNEIAPIMKSMKYAMLALAQGANTDEVEDILANGKKEYFEGVKFKVNS